MTSQERFAVNYQVEHLQTKYVGTGHADTSKLCALARAVFSVRTRQRAVRASWHAWGALTHPVDTLASAPLANKEPLSNCECLPARRADGVPPPSPTRRW